MKTEKETTPIFYKGFDKDWSCRGFKYGEPKGQIFTTDKPILLCNFGFHACEAPLDIWDYYPPFDGNVAGLVELGGVSDEKEKDTKRVGSSITIKAAITIPALIAAQIEWTFNAAKKFDHVADKDSVVVSSGYYSKAASSGYYSKAASSGDSSKAASSGNYSTAASSGDSSTAASSGYYSKAASSGNSSTAASSGNVSKAASSGDYSKAASSGYYSTAASSGDSSKAASSGDSSTAASSGDSSTAASSGDVSKAASSGDSSKAASSGNSSTAASSGDYSKAASSGYYSTAASSGNSSTAASSGDYSKAACDTNGFACVAGLNGRVKGGSGSALSLGYKDLSGKNRIAVGYVGENGIKEGVFYRCDDNGNLVPA